MHGKTFLALEGLESCGCVFSLEKRAAVDISLTIKQQETGLANLVLWGCLYTTNGKDYLLAKGYNKIHQHHKVVQVEYLYYFSQDGKKWLDLHPIPSQTYEKCKEIKENFRGDVGATFFVPDAIQPPRPPKIPRVKPPLYVPPGPPPKPKYVLGKLLDLRVETPPEAKSQPKEDEKGKETKGKEEAGTSKDSAKDSQTLSVPLKVEAIWDEMDDAPKVPKPVEVPVDMGPKGVEIRELERLSALVRWIDYECSVAPIGGLVLTTSKQLVEAIIWNEAMDIGKLECYGKLLKGYENALLSDDPNGVWTIHVDPLTKEVTIRSCMWPGYHFYYSHITKAWGSLYFGMGFKQTIDQVAFMI